MTVATIITEVAAFHLISEAALKGRSTEKRYRWPRTLAMALAAELTDESPATIGKAFGGRAYRSVEHARGVLERHRRRGVAADQRVIVSLVNRLRDVQQADDLVDKLDATRRELAKIKTAVLAILSQINAVERC